MSTIMSEHDVRTLAAAAQEHFKQKTIDPALAAFRTLHQIRPANAHWAERTAQCEMLLKRWPEAQIAWAETIARHGVSAGRASSLARCFIETRDYRSAHTLLTSAYAEIAPNAHFFAISSMSALAAGDRAAALRLATSIEESAGDKSGDVIDYLCALLRRLATEDRGNDVIWLIDALLAVFQTRKSLLRLGVFTANCLLLFEKAVCYAKEIRTLHPADIRYDITYLSSLLDAQQLDAALGQLDAIDERYPKSDRSPHDEKSIENLRQLLLARPKWQAVLHGSTPATTFFSLNLQLSALMTLKAYHDVISMAEHALSSHADHPWFMSILAKAHDKLGRMDVAAEWLTKAMRCEPGRIAYAFQLADVLVRLGKLMDAADIAGKLAASHPGLPATRALLGKVGALASGSDKFLRKSAKIAVQQHETWLHGGDSGDIIYALAAVKGGGGGSLFLTSIAGTREPMTEEKVAFLSPLLRAQSYIDHVAAWQGEPISRDFNLFRQYPLQEDDLVTQQWRSVLDDAEPDIRTSWLALPAREKHGRPVFARSLRYRNPDWDAFWCALKQASPDAIFVGTTDEFKAFGHGEHFLAGDALELANIIHGASIFVGNQSLPYAIAEGMKIRRMLEVFRPLSNCCFPGALALPYTSRL